MRIWAAGLAGSALVALLEPLAPADPFRTTILILPLVIAALNHLRRCATGGRGGRSGVVEGALLLTLVLATVARGRLGLDYPDRWLDAALAGGYVLILAAATAPIALASRRLLRAGRSARPPLFFLALPWVVYLAILPWSAEHRMPNGDEPYNLLVAHSLAYDLDADLSNNYRNADSLAFMDRRLEPQPGDPVGPDGAVYSRHNLTLPLILAPFYRLAGKYAALVLMTFFTAATAWMTLRVALLYYPAKPGAALLCWALVGFAPPLLFYSAQVWVEVPAALLVLVALERVHLLEQRPQSLASWLSLIASLALLSLLKVRFVLVVVPLFGLAVWRGRKGVRFLLWGAGVLLLLGSSILAYNAIVFGSALKTHGWGSLSLVVNSPPERFARGLLGLLFDAAFGLACWAPLWLLLIPALLLLARRRHRLAADLLLCFGPYLLFLAPRAEWYGGWSPPFRYGLVALPFLGAALVPLFADRNRWGARFLVTVLAAVTVALGVAGVVFPNWTYNLADGRSQLLDVLTIALGADLSRFFPSLVRPRTASWIWPAASLLILPSLWWSGGRRRTGATRAALAGLLIASALLVFLARGLPSAVVEAEDPYVEHQGGSLYPGKWTPSRISYRGGWLMGAGDLLRAAIAAGGDTVVVEIDIDTKRIKPPGLELILRAGDEELQSWQIRRPAAWQRLRSGELAWPRSEPLVLTVGAPPKPASRSRLLVDRVRFDWRGDTQDR